MVRFTDATGQPRVVLIDASPDLRQQLLREGVDRLDAIVFTHNHVDHTFGLDEVRRFNAIMKQPIDIYAERPVLDSLRRVYKHVFDQKSNVQPSFVATLIAHEIEPGRPLDLFGVRFTPIRLLHGRLPILGYRIEPVPGGSDRSLALPARKGATREVGGVASGRPGGGAANAAAGDETSPPPSNNAPPWWPLAWCTDCSAVPPETWADLNGLGTLCLDALRHRNHPTHFTLGQAVGVAHRVEAQQTLFIHMAHDLGHAETEAELPDGMKLGYDGLTLGE